MLKLCALAGGDLATPIVDLGERDFDQSQAYRVQLYLTLRHAGLPQD